MRSLLLLYIILLFSLQFQQKIIQAFSFSFWKTVFSARIQMEAQPFSIERMQASWNRPVSQKRLKFCL
jgi:hypothetical protein